MQTLQQQQCWNSKTDEEKIRDGNIENSLKIIVKQFEASAEYMTTTFAQLATLSGITQRQARPR